MKADRTRPCWGSLLLGLEENPFLSSIWPQTRYACQAQGYLWKKLGPGDSFCLQGDAWGHLQAVLLPWVIVGILTPS